MEAAQLQRLRARAHVHTDKCLNQQPSANQGRDSLDEITPRFICGKREDADLVALLAAYDELVATSGACARTLRDTQERYFDDDPARID